MALAAILTAAEHVLPLVTPYMPPALQVALAIVNGLLIVAAMAARLLAQKSMEEGQENETGH